MKDATELLSPGRQVGDGRPGTLETTLPASGVMVEASEEEFAAGGKVAAAGEVAGEVQFVIESHCGLTSVPTSSYTTRLPLPV